MSGRARQITQKVLSFYRMAGIFGLGYIVGGIVVASMMVGGTAAILGLCQ